MKPSPSPMRTYPASILLALAALALTGVTVRPLGAAYTYFSFMAVLVSALYGGLGPGIAAVALSAIGLDFLYLGPPFRLGGETADELHRLVGFTLFGLAATWIAARFRAAHREAVEARRAAEGASEEARRVGELQERLVAVVSHDLRNPLAALRGNVDLMPRLGALTERQTRAVASMRRTVDRMESLIRDLLDVSRSRRGRMLAISRAEVCLGEICSHVRAEIRDANPGAEIAVEVKGDDRAAVDAARVAQAVANLVSNALQHGAAGSPVSVRVSGSDGEVVLEVENSGPPISEELRPHVFEPFMRGRDEGPGLGLGLFVVGEIARAHGGRASFRSDGSGTVFEVRLPRRPGTPAPEAPPP